MGLLKEEYKKHKEEKQKLINEAAMQWVLDNVLLLNETFNRDSLQKLQSAIVKFENTFSPFASKVPEVQKSLDQTIDMMNKITMGEKITKKDGVLKLTKDEKESVKEPATYAIKYLSIMYNNLSRFFNKDMSVLLGFPLFKKAHDNPETPLKDLVDSDKMRKAILHALVPGTEIQTILKRMYRTMELPSLNYDIIADELLNLSYDNFRELMKMDKVPLVATVEKNGTEEATGTNPKVVNDNYVLTEEDEAILKEIGEVNPKQLESVVSGIVKIQGILKGFPELANTNQKLEQLRAQALAIVSQGGIKNAPKAKMIAATANSLYDYFDKLGELWPKLEPLIPVGRQMSEAEIKNVETFLQRAQGGMLAKISNWFKSKLVPGMNPNEISADIMNVVRAGQAKENPIEAGQSLKNFFQRLQGLKLAPAVSQEGQPITGASASPQQTQGTAGSQSMAGTTGASQTTSGAAGQQSQATSQPANPQPNVPDAKELASEMGKAMGINGQNQGFIDQVNTLLQAGWNITPPGSQRR